MQNLTNTQDRLDRRIAANRGGARDMTAFLLDLAQPSGTDAVLDLGCGPGTQVIRLAPMVKSVLALDISEELLAAFSKRLGDHKNVELMACGMDEATARLSGRRFDLIQAVYSIYYSQDLGRLIGDIAHHLLAPGGRFLTISPDIGNNAEWYEDLGRIFPVDREIIGTSGISRRVVGHALDSFADVRCVRFVNEIRYPTVDDLMSYYDGCGAYCPADRRAAAFAHFARRIEAEGHYAITKRALAILARDPVAPR